MPRRAIDVSGQTFGYLTVLRRDHAIHPKGAAWIVRCTCGREKSMVYSAMRKSRSCGCMKYEMVSAALRGRKRPRTKPSVSETEEYKIWIDILRRAHRGSTPAAKHYLHRGITVCPRWLVFSNFLADMGQRPSPAHTVDRIDNDRGYEPNNCRWATIEIQCRNRRNNVWIEAQGKRLVLQDWADLIGCRHGTILHRIRKLGWSPERAVTTPVGTWATRRL